MADIDVNRLEREGSLPAEPGWGEGLHRKAKQRTKAHPSERSIRKTTEPMGSGRFYHGRPVPHLPPRPTIGSGAHRHLHSTSLRRRNLSYILLADAGWPDSLDFFCEGGGLC